ncbi:SUMF1/EgtB/PvdO family nonheme iron enzyme [Engelhardtia mirabilis]|uniref:SUMF1/EgtB/PvdO family nonheme iron enzyme n=1 Tax=Engelhardtia mirabilis TaxID=2528011 RepID=UPI003AF36180
MAPGSIASSRSCCPLSAGWCAGASASTSVGVPRDDRPGRRARRGAGLRPRPGPRGVVRRAERAGGRRPGPRRLERGRHPCPRRVRRRGRGAAAPRRATPNPARPRPPPGAPPHPRARGRRRRDLRGSPGAVRPRLHGRARPHGRWVAAGDCSRTRPSERSNRASGPRGAHRVLRGGSYWNDADNCRSAYRNRNRPWRRNDNVGFRVVLPSPRRPAAAHGRVPGIEVSRPEPGRPPRRHDPAPWSPPRAANGGGVPFHGPR